MESSDDPRSDRARIDRWLSQWGNAVLLDKETEYTWELEAPLVALRELPRQMFITSDWATYPISPAGDAHEEWASHFDDGKALPGFNGWPPNKSLERARDE